MSDTRVVTPQEQFEQHLLEKNMRAQELCYEFNMTHPTKTQMRDKVLRKLIGSVGENVRVVSPFYCGYGHNISIGDDVYINLGATFLDDAKIVIGKRVVIGPHCNIYTVAHDKLYLRRDTNYVAPVVIEDDVWIGGNVTILKGVTIGRGSVIAAGSLIRSDIPPMTLAYSSRFRDWEPIVSPNWHNNMYVAQAASAYEDPEFLKTLSPSLQEHCRECFEQLHPDVKD